MATEEVGRPPSLPQYPQMIVEAIAALNPKDGANKSAISKYIESKYGELPAGHSNLLSAHLTRMKDSGELVFFKNNYLVPDPSAPPRRGRGRPPKSKDPSSEKEAAPAATPAATTAAGAPTSPRGRGRPRKDPNAEPAPKKPKPAPAVSKTGRPRGRPRKVIPAAAVGAANGV